MKKYIPSAIALAAALVLGAAAHEWAWPHVTIEIGEGGGIHNVKTVDWRGALFVQADGVPRDKVVISDAYVDGKFGRILQ